MKSETTKHLIILALVALAALVVWEIFKTIQAGEASIGKILAAPFTGLASAWKAITGLFSFGSTPKQDVTDEMTSGILGLNGLPITGDNALASLLLPAVDTTSTLPAGWNWQAYQ
jgi:hypothetical protein